MKIKSIFLPLLIASFSLISCGNNDNNNSQNNEYDDSISFEEPASYKSYWGNKEVEEAIESTIRYDIPYYKANNYVVDTFKDDLNDDVLVIYFEGYVNEEVDINRDKYVNICISAGYKSTSDKISNGNEGTTDLYSLSKSIGNRENILINVVSGRRGEGLPYCFAAFASRFYDFKSEVFPNYVLKHYFGYKIPVVEDSNASYTCTTEYNSQAQMKDAYIEISGIAKSYEQKLYALLKDSGYEIDSEFYDDYGYMATSKNKTHMVQFKYVGLTNSLGDGIAMFTWPLEQQVTGGNA